MKFQKSRKASVDDFSEFIIVVMALAFIMVFILIGANFIGKDMKKSFDERETEITTNSAMMKFLQSTAVDEGKEKNIQNLILEMEIDNPGLLDSRVDDEKANLVGQKMGDIFDTEIGEDRWYVFIKYSEKIELKASTKYSLLTGEASYDKFLDNCNVKYHLPIVQTKTYIPKPQTKNNADVVEMIMEAC